MNKEELIILKIVKTFQGKIVNDYPCKGAKFSEATPSHYLEGLKSVNPRSVERN
jgi:hypothetical protein